MNDERTTEVACLVALDPPVRAAFLRSLRVHAADYAYLAAHTPKGDAMKDERTITLATEVARLQRALAASEQERARLDDLLCYRFTEIETLRATVAAHRAVAWRVLAEYAAVLPDALDARLATEATRHRWQRRVVVALRRVVGLAWLLNTGAFITAQVVAGPATDLSWWWWVFSGVCLGVVEVRLAQADLA